MRDKRPRWAFELKVELLTLRLKKARPAQLARPNNLLGGGEARAAQPSDRKWRAVSFLVSILIRRPNSHIPQARDNNNNNNNAEDDDTIPVGVWPYPHPAVSLRETTCVFFF
jgi:hypothetical protein